MRELFELFVDAVAQGTSYDNGTYGHSSIPAWEGAYEYLGIKKPLVSARQFEDAVSTKCRELFGEGRAA